MPLAHEFPNHLFLFQHIYLKYYSGHEEEEDFALRLQDNDVVFLRELLMRQGDKEAQRTKENI